MWCFSIPISGGCELPLPHVQHREHQARTGVSWSLQQPRDRALLGPGQWDQDSPRQPCCTRPVCDRHGSQVTVAGTALPRAGPSAWRCLLQGQAPLEPGPGQLLQLRPPELSLTQGWGPGHCRSSRCPLQQPGLSPGSRLFPAVFSRPGLGTHTTGHCPGPGRCHRSCLTPNPCLSLKGLVCTHQGTRRTSMN